MLIGVALLFWGWQAELLPVAIVLACVLEGSRFVKTRWQFSQADLNRIWNLCTFLFVGALALAVLSEQGMWLFDNSPRATSPAGRARDPPRHPRGFSRAYHTRHAVLFTIGDAAGQLNAFWNSGKFATTPFTRY